MFPGQPFEAVCLRLKAAEPQAGQASSEPNEFTDFMRARQAIAEEIEENSKRTLPTFLPGISVQETRAYGHIIYQKAAALTDSEVLHLVGKSAQSLGLTPWSSETNAFGATNNYYIVSLQGIPAEMLNMVRKIKVFYEVSASRDTSTVTPDTMLSPLQATTCFEHVASQYSGTRPSGILSGSLKTITELQELAVIMDTVIQEQMEQDAEEGDLEAAAAAAMLEPEGDKSAASRALSGLQQMDTPAPKRQAKKRKDASHPASGSDPKRGSKALEAGPAVLALPPCENTGTPSTALPESGSQTSKKQKNRDADLAAMDEEMQKVARLHVSTKSAGSAKGLANLIPAKFMSIDPDTSNHDRSHALVAVPWACVWPSCCCYASDSC